MTRKFIYSILCCLAVLAVACTHEEDNKNNFKVEPGAGTTITIPAQSAAVQTITVTTNTTWTVTVNNGSWLTVDPMSGIGNSTIVITAADNDSKDQRTATITIDSDGNTPQISIAQAGLGQLPPVQGNAITGDATNNCPYTNTILLTTTAITGATSYEWYCNGTHVASTSALTYTTPSTPGSFAYTVAGKNAAGEGEPGPEKRITITECELPADAGEIQGDDENTCPKKTVDLTIDPIENAVSYQWYKDGTAISGAETTSYTVTTTGTYTVAGVNIIGEGVKSSAKVVTIVQCEVPESIEGEWTATGWAFFESEAAIWDDEIVAENDTAFQLTNFAGLGATQPPLYVYQNEAGEYYLANIDARIGTITYQGSALDLFQVVGGYTSRDEDGVYSIQGLIIPLTLSEDGYTLSMPSTMVVNLNGIPTEIYPALGSMVTLGGTKYWWDCIGELVYERKGTPSPRPIQIVKKPDFKPQTIQTVKAVKVSKSIK